MENKVLRIEVEPHGTPEFFKEVTNVATQQRKLMKRPEKKLSNQFFTMGLYAILCALWFVLLLIMGFAWGFTGLDVAALIIMAFTCVVSLLYYLALKRFQKQLMEDKKKTIVVLDEDGVELEKVDAQVLRMSWDNVVFARRFDHVICFFGEGGAGFMIFVSREYEKEITEYLEAYRPNLIRYGWVR